VIRNLQEVEQGLRQPADGVDLVVLDDDWALDQLRMGDYARD